jgi:hypothetical protein
MSQADFSPRYGSVVFLPICAFIVSASGGQMEKTQK